MKPRTNSRAFRSFTATILAASAAFLSSPAADAALVIYEGFDYGDTDGVALEGKGTTTNGWIGAWDDYSGNNSSTKYSSTGLSFGTLVTTGGSALATAGSNSRGQAGRQHSQTITGDLFGSYIFKKNSGSVNNTMSGVMSSSTINSSDTNADLIWGFDKYGSSEGWIKMASGSGSTSTAGNNVGNGTTFMALFMTTGLGTTGTQSLTEWILTLDQFNHFKTLGLTAANLDSASTGSASTSVFQRLSVTKTDASNSFDANDFLQLFTYENTSSTFDELRFGTASLDEVTPLVPEPSVLSLAILAMLPLLARRRRS